MSDFFYAYRIECYDDNEWKIHALVVSAPGVAVRDWLDSAKSDKKDKVRIKRIETVEELRTLDQLRSIHFHQDFDGQLIKMLDGYAQIGDK